MSIRTNSFVVQLAKFRSFVVFATIAAVGFYLLKDYLSFEVLSKHREFLIEFRDSNYALAAAIFILGYTLFVAFSVPGGLILSVTGGFMFATFPGVFYNILGATCGATSIFLAARWGFGARLAATLESSEGMVKKIKDGIDENQWTMLFLIRLIPGVPFFLANLVPSFLDVSLRRFVISTFLGIFPGALVFTSIGAGLGDVFERGETPNFGIFWEPKVILPLLGLCALSMLPILIKAVRGKKGL